jgi:hypothetical protein
MGEFSDFGKRMRARGRRVTSNVDRLVRRTALAVDQTVVLATPVDTGRARSNWLVTLGTPSHETREPYVPGEGGATAGANVQAALDQGRQVIKGYSGDVDSGISIANNLPYIGRLNEGWSAQAPANFVEQAVLAGVAAIRAEAGKITTGKVSEE